MCWYWRVLASSSGQSSRNAQEVWLVTFNRSFGLRLNLVLCPSLRFSFVSAQSPVQWIPQFQVCFGMMTVGVYLFPSLFNFWIFYPLPRPKIFWYWFLLCFLGFIRFGYKTVLRALGFCVCTGCSTALLPARVVQALNLKLDDVGSQTQLHPRFNGSFAPDVGEI